MGVISRIEIGCCSKFSALRRGAPVMAGSCAARTTQELMSFNAKSGSDKKLTEQIADQTSASSCIFHNLRKRATKQHHPNGSCTRT